MLGVVVALDSISHQIVCDREVPWTLTGRRLPPPTDDQVAHLTRRVARRLQKRAQRYLEGHQDADALGDPDDEEATLQLALSTALRPPVRPQLTLLPAMDEDPTPPPPRRCTGRPARTESGSDPTATPRSIGRLVPVRPRRPRPASRLRGSHADRPSPCAQREQPRPPKRKRLRRSHPCVRHYRSNAHRAPTLALDDQNQLLNTAQRDHHEHGYLSSSPFCWMMCFMRRYAWSNQKMMSAPR